MSKSIFISHATVDRDLAESFVEFLEQGIGVPEKEIFCSSLPSYGIPTGVDFVDYMKNQMQTPTVVILLLTKSYFKSNFCLCEMGASWALSHKIFPIIVPPLTYGDVKDVLLGVQAMKIDDDIKYNELRDYLGSQISLHSTSNSKWDTKRQAFLRKLPDLLAKLKSPSEITVAEHESLRKKFDEASSELAKYEDEVGTLKKLVKGLEKAKDKTEVVAIKKDFETNSIIDEADTLLNEIKSTISTFGGREVGKFILCDYYGQPYEIDWFADKAMFDNAARSKLIKIDDGESANWSNKNLKKLRGLLDALSKLVDSDEDGALETHSSHNGEPDFEPDNQEFWNYHYSV
jgi:hypothetical protein